MLTWVEFKKIARAHIGGSAIVSEVLFSLIVKNEKKVKQMMGAGAADEQYLGKLVDSARTKLRTPMGRKEVNKIAAEHLVDSKFASDDVSLRRAYNLYRTGKGFVGCNGLTAKLAMSAKSSNNKNIKP